MPNTRYTVSALVSAFNVHNYARNTVETNFTLQSRHGKNFIVVSFDKGMGKYQCSRYLDSIKRKIVGEFYSIEEGNTDEVVLNTANLIFNIESFPFKTSKEGWSQDKQGRFEFLALIDDGVIFNLKSHFASSLVKDVLEDMPTCSIVTNSFKKEKYLCHSKFPNKKLRKEFEHEFLSRMRERYQNVPEKPLEVNDKDNSVYIKDVFDNARFIDSVTRYKAWLTGMDLGVGNDVDHSVKSFKNMIIRSTYSVTKVMIDGFILAPPLGRKDASVLVPIILDDKGARLLTHEEALKLNYTFNNVVLGDLNSKTQAKLSVNGSSEVYGIDFSNPYISHCVITKIIKNSVINKDHELSIDPKLRFRALSRSPSTELSNMELESPTCSQSVASKDSPRQRSEEGEEGPRLLNYVNSVRTSDRPLTDLSYATTSCGVPGISRDLSAGEGTLTEANIPDQKRSSLTPFPTAWNDSTFLNLEGSNEEPEKQQVTDKSDRKSSDEYSEAKSQDSKSPEKKHGDGLLCSNSSIGSMWSKLKGNVLPSLKRNNKGRGSVYSISSSVSAPVGPVTKKPPGSKSFLSFPTRKKAKSNPPSEVTSPTHEGVPEWQQRLDPDQREELRLFLSPELRKKLDSNSLSPEDEQLKHLLYTPSGQEKMKKNFESQEENLRQSVNEQLPANSSSKKVDRDSGFSSMGSPASPVVQHKGSAPLKVTECSVQQVNSHSVERT